jgi:P4 family phage/plasmid primase-like protien
MVEIDLIIEQKYETKSYSCKECGSIIKSNDKPEKCPVCDCVKFTLLNINQKDVKLRVLSLFQRKQFGEGTEILVDTIKSFFNIYTTKVDKAQEIYIYKEGIYLPEGESEIKQFLRVVLEENYSEWVASQVISKIKTDTFIEPEVFFKEGKIFEVAVKNGILDLQNASLREFSPQDIFFSKMPVNFNITCECNKIDSFLSEVLSSEEDKNVFYEIAGFGLIKEYIFERAFMLVGNGRNGKSKSIELLKYLVGNNNCSSIPLSSLSSESPFLCGLWKKYFNLSGDLSSSDLKETGTFKLLTGRDYVSANRKYKNFIEFKNYAKLVFACNELPRVYDYSDGFWDRWILLEFPYKFVDKEEYDNSKDKSKLKIKNPNIIDEITTEEELSGFLNQALLGLNRLLNNKRFSYSIGTAEVKNKWIRRSDSFMAFCMDCIDEDCNCKISKKELRLKYKDFCSKHKIKSLSDKSILITLQELFGVYDSKVYVGINQEYVWEGIKWKN